jgi:tetratricopeptide (TPR) repeat protein
MTERYEYRMRKGNIVRMPFKTKNLTALVCPDKLARSLTYYSSLSQNRPNDHQKNLFSKAERVDNYTGYAILIDIMDPNNPVIQLCSQGMQAEAKGQFEDARAIFQQAWDIHANDYEGCIAAHYLARHQDSPEESLRWNQESLDRANAVADDSVKGFFPSLYLNMGYSYEVLGELDQAEEYYEKATERVDDLPDDAYGEVVRGGVAEGRKRIQLAKANR